MQLGQALFWAVEQAEVVGVGGEVVVVVEEEVVVVVDEELEEEEEVVDEELVVVVEELLDEEVVVIGVVCVRGVSDYVWALCGTEAGLPMGLCWESGKV